MLYQSRASSPTPPRFSDPLLISDTHLLLNLLSSNLSEVQQKFQSLDSLPKERKKNDYIDAMLDDVIRKLNETQTTPCRTTLQPGDPPLIAPTIAPFQSPPTSVLVAEMKTRFTLIEPSWHLLVEIK